MLLVSFVTPNDTPRHKTTAIPIVIVENPFACVSYRQPRRLRAGPARTRRSISWPSKQMTTFLDAVAEQKSLARFIDHFRSPKICKGFLVCVVAANVQRGSIQVRAVHESVFGSLREGALSFHLQLESAEYIFKGR